jgi:hypothetical protein
MAELPVTIPTSFAEIHMGTDWLMDGNGIKAVLKSPSIPLAPPTP